MPDSCPTTATVVAQHARSLAFAKTCRCTAYVLQLFRPIEPLVSQHRRYFGVPSFLLVTYFSVDLFSLCCGILRGSYTCILPSQLRMALFVTGCSSLNHFTDNSMVSFHLSQLCPSILPGLAILSLSSTGRLHSHLWTGNLAFSNISVASSLNCFSSSDDLSSLSCRHRYSIAVSLLCP